jgi:excinuclease UvrABC helicase subunit UvrB
LDEIKKETKEKKRVLVTTLTKRTAEDLSEYLTKFIKESFVNHLPSEDIKDIRTRAEPRGTWHFQRNVERALLV